MCSNGSEGQEMSSFEDMEGYYARDYCILKALLGEMANTQSQKTDADNPHHHPELLYNLCERMKLKDYASKVLQQQRKDAGNDNPTGFFAKAVSLCSLAMLL